jgi:hypothetical protein
MDHAQNVVDTAAPRTGVMSTARIEAFSDGVFAIVVTLLVRTAADAGDRASPSLPHSLAKMSPLFRVTDSPRDHVIQWSRITTSLCSRAFEPNAALAQLPVSVLARLDSVSHRAARQLPEPHHRARRYGLIMVLCGLTFSGIGYYACFRAKLVYPRIDPRVLRSWMLKSISNPLLHSLAVLLALVDRRLALALYVLIPLLFVIPSRLEKATFARP